MEKNNNKKIMLRINNIQLSYKYKEVSDEKEDQGLMLKIKVCAP